MNCTKTNQTTITQVFLVRIENQESLYQNKLLRNYIKRKQT